MDNYQYIIAPAAGWLVAQTLKYIFVLGKNGFQLNDLISSGGMPSSHAATVASVTTLIGLNEGFESALFGLALTVTMIVSYDARGVRRSVQMLNYSVSDLLKKSEKLPKQALVMAKGHSTIEVVAGLLVGAIVGIITFII